MTKDAMPAQPGFLLSRRHVLAGAAALAAPAVIGSEARAQASKVVISTWGGDYARLLRENVEAPLLQKQGVEVIQDVGDQAPRVAKIQAQRRLPRGSTDVVSVEAVAAYQLAEMGLLEELTPTKVPNLKYLQDSLRSPTYAAHIYSPQLLIYSPERVQAPPTSFTDLFDPKYKNRVGVTDVNFFYAVMGASLYASGTTNDMEKAKELVTRVNANGMKLFPTTDAGGPAFRSGEVDIGLMWMARIIMWQNAGISVKGAFPKEGCVVYVSGMGVPKNAPNKEAAYKYINAMLEPSAQRGFAEQMGYLPTITNAGLTGKVAEQLALPDPAPRLVVPDYGYTTKVQPEIADWWKKTIQRA
ncbi:Extracellular solute-binding protein [Rhodovastum atsumiense]|uniref:Extracellular solute-binding protein n=1 Tax=Rhodovastum atsumiense TaxID=504468 RepID=A0A5M6J1K5_9PROT|nr:extracellular solute-binding protein [Rhodovastum atsumiense]KAA5614099.1 extracellular solute-binding protein [Rhodovastum atsumiense]CAH2598938.1 Extracellular solute-binding protein [Rhodovastum atsumiense]